VTVGSESPQSADLLALLKRGQVLVLTGAGVSTASGIPDYRDETGAWKHPPPIQFREFTGSEARRKRYWARSFLGWSRMQTARPNPSHAALTRLEELGLLSLLVTQNVDRLHQSAGSRKVVDLHGRIDRVVCLQCGESSARESLQAALGELNPAWAERAAVAAPDGDAEPGATDYDGFRVPGCSSCGGVLKPDVVFFGEHVPADRVARAMDALAEARALLVVGSSLMVFSGYRFARAAAQRQLPIAIVNRGRTRADELAALKFDANAGELLTRVAAELHSAA
jgi:NAD-dependent SIR2 family protein deacetylase